jgi:hypothetical protein
MTSSRLILKSRGSDVIMMLQTGTSYSSSPT